MKSRVIDFVSSNYIFFMIPLSILVMYMNWHAPHEISALPRYDFFVRAIKSNFTTEYLPTFPMWGYAWFMLITQHKLALLCIQMIIGLCALYYAIKWIEESGGVTPHLLKILKLSLIFSIPWYSFYSIRWPNCIASSFFLLSITLLYKTIVQKEIHFGALLGSGLFFGLGLHFRSDYCLMPVGFVLLIVLFLRTKRMASYMAVWFITIYICLIPWGLYTKKACGHYLLTSTNGGHVAFVGLGNDPYNRWAIGVTDFDPVMLKVVNDHFKTSNHSTLDYEADQLLKRTVISYIFEFPWDYFKKCLYSFYLVATQGFYPGEFFYDQAGDILFLKKARIREVVVALLKQPLLMVRNPLSTLKVFMTGGSYVAGVIVLFLSYLFLPLTLNVALRRRQLFMLLVIAALVYQTLINVMTQHRSDYPSTLYIFFLLNAMYGFSLLRAFFMNYKSIVGAYRKQLKISF